MQIFRFNHRAFGDQVTRTAIHPPQEDHPRFWAVRQTIANILAYRTIEDFMHMILITEYVGQRKHIDVREYCPNRRH
ncbi:hypothetical protein D3C75_1170020 [compost metagenome]